MSKTNQKSSKYQNLLLQSQTQKEEAQILFKVKEAKLQLQSDILATEKSLVNAESELDKLKGQYPFNSQAIIDAQIKVQGLSDGLARLKDLEKELF